MAARNLQKIFYFSNEQNKNFVEEILQRKASKENRSVSFLIEEALLNSLLPENEQAKFILQYKLCGEHAVRDTLESVFSYNAAGISYKSIYANFKPLLEFAIMNCHNVNHQKSNDESLTHFFSQYEAVVNRIEKLSLYCVNPNEKEYYKTQASLARMMYTQATEDNRTINYRNILILVRDCWDMLCDWTFTYRLLSDIALFNREGWNEHDFAREELFELISEVSKEWRDENRADQIRV